MRFELQCIIDRNPENDINRYIRGLILSIMLICSLLKFLLTYNIFLLIINCRHPEQIPRGSLLREAPDLGRLDVRLTCLMKAEVE
jgi:hypothetical protein